MVIATKQKNGRQRPAADKYFNLTEHAADGIAIIQDGVIKLVNTALVRISGYDKEELLGMPFTKLLTPESQKLTLARYQARLAGKKVPPIYEIKAVTQDGKVRDIEVNAALTEYEGRVADEVIIRDVTERKRVEEALQTEKNKLQSVIDAIEYSLTIMDKDYNIIYQSQPSIINGDYYLGEKCYRVYEGQDRVCDGCPVAKAFKDGKYHTAERRIVLPSGEAQFLENTACPIRDASGKITSCLEVTRDITQRKQAEEELRQAEEEKSALLEEAPIAIFNTDLKGKITYVNKRFESESGYSREEIVGKNGFKMDWLPAGTMKYFTQRMAARLRGGPSKHWATQFKRKDGRWIWIEIEGKVLRKLGVPVGFQIVARNITERKQAEEALQTEKNKLQSMINAMEYGLSIQDTDFNIIYQSEPSRMTDGYHLGEKCYRVYEGKDKVCDGCPVEKAFRDGKSHTSVRRIVTSSGEVAFLENTASPIRDASGEITSCLEITRDITQRKQAEEELQQSNRRFSDIVENALEWIWEVDSSGKYTYASPVVEKILGYKPEEMLEKHFYDLFHPDDRRELKEAAFTAFAQKQPFRQFVNRNIHKNGETVWLSTSGVPILDEEGNLLGYRGADVDITERKQAEEELKLRVQILDGATDSIFVHDADDNFIYVNEAACRTHGYSREEFLKMKIPQIVDPERSRPLASDRQELLEKGYIVVESAHLRKDGSIVPVEVHARTLESGGGKLFLTVARDITERKQAEEALKLQTAYFQQLFDNSPEAIVLLNENNIIVNTNKGFETLFGYTLEEVKGKPISEVIVPENHIEEARTLGQAFLNNEVSRQETVRKRKDGSRVAVALLAYPIWSGSKVVGAYVIYTDITERKQVEEELRESEKKYRTIFENVSEVIIRVDRYGKIVDINGRAEECFGYKPEEVIGKNFAKMGVLSLKDMPKMVKVFGEIIRGKRAPFIIELEAKRKDGSPVLIEVNSKLVKRNGKAEGFVAIVRDITERKRAEEQLRQAKEEFQALAEESPLGVSVLGKDGRYQYLNPKFIEMFGYTLEDIPTGREWFIKAFPDPEYRTQVISNWVTDARSSKRGEVSPQTYTVTCKDGSDKIIHFRPVALETGDYFVIYEDITERRQAEEALRESEERYRAVIEGAHDMIQSVTPDGRIIFVNQAWLDTLGYTEAELPSLNLFKIIHPDSQPHCQKLFAKVLRGEPVHEVEASFLTKDGRRILVEGSATPRYIGDKVVATQGIFRNITERKQMEQQLQEKNEQLDSQNEELKAINEELQAAEGKLQEKNEQLDSQNEELRAINEELRVTEEELQQSQEKLERMFESVTDGIIVADLDGTIIKVNERAVQMHGFASEGELLGKTAFELVAPSDHKKIAENMRKAIKEGSIRSQEYTLRKADGSEFPGELSTSMLKDGWGNIVGHITIARDITKRKQMEELFRTVTNSSPVGIYIIQDRKFQLANPQFQKLTGYTEDELRGMDSLALVVDEDRDKVREEAVKMLQGKRSSPYQFRVVNKAGETRWVMETVTSIQYRGRKATLGNYMDITERRQAEEREDQLQQELNLASRLASVGQLAAGVAHEINNPLTGVIGFSHLMLGRDIPDDIKQDLQVINSEAQRVAKIVENLLTFAHQRKPGRECVDINGIITRVLELRAYEMKVNNIEVETQFTPDLPYTMADAGQLQQVFLNIVLNAEHFMIKAHNKGKLLVKTERIDGNIRVSFTDDGTGISKENLDKIFNPFFTTKEVGSGTGLGLSICHGIITQHKGRIYAQSELGKGATFVVELPIVDEPNQTGKAEVIEEKPQKPRGAKILVVDDEPAVLDFLGRLLTEWGHNVETINNAETALERLKAERYSLILLDIKLPGMSGIELYQHIEEIAPALTRRVMFITGDIMENATRGFLEKTKAPHITKPLNIEILKKAINRALNQTQVVAKTPG